MNLKKPQPINPIRKNISYKEIENYFQSAYNKNLRDWKNYRDHFYKWCDQKGYPEYDPEGYSRSNSQIWYSEYQKDSKGAKKAPSYCDFWHWLISRFDFKKNQDIKLGVNPQLWSEYVPLEKWVKGILLLLHHSFREYEDKKGYLRIYINF